MPSASSDHLYATALGAAEWEIDAILGLDPNVEQYKLKKLKDAKMSGHAFRIEGKSHFNSGYFGPCGNDNFTDVDGRYEFVAPDRLTIWIDEVTYTGDWHKPTEKRGGQKLTFIVSRQGEGWLFSKIK